MTEQSGSGSTIQVTADAPELRNQLVRRLAVAGGLVAILLGMLAIFDHFSQPADEQEVRVFTEPVPVGPRKMVTQPVTPVEPVADEAIATQDDAPVDPAVADVLAVPDGTPPPPDVAAQPVIEPAVRSMPTARPRLRPAVPGESEIAPDMTSAPPIVPTPAAPVSSPKATVPSARLVESTPAATAPPRLFSGFVLQAGVFASAQRAEELHAKLTLSGVQSSIETRVQVGPFRTRKEAAEAQEKLRELGIDSILIAPRGGR